MFFYILVYTNIVILVKINESHVTFSYMPKTYLDHIHPQIVLSHPSSLNREVLQRSICLFVPVLVSVYTHVCESVCCVHT